MRTPIINVMDRAARRAGRGLARDFGELQQLQVSRKGPDNFAAAAQRKIRQILHDELTKARPDFAFCEGKAGVNEGDQWFVCPLDGATNFLHGLAHFSIAIAHTANGVLSESIVYDPLREELFWAVRNTGAYLNDNRLRVSARRQLHDCVVATPSPPRDGEGMAMHLARLSAVAGAVADQRNFGTPALDLAYVAAGRLDGSWHQGVPFADTAAGILLVREAGGFVTDGTGRDELTRDAQSVAANDQVHGALLAYIRGGAAAA